jgi:TRAP-type C4-dicarboxylate transport system permease small subunit
MRWFVKTCNRLGSWMNGIAGTIIFFMMGLTVVDVILRFFGKPITGTYELISVSGAIVIGYAIPRTSLDHGHISVDLFTDRASESLRNRLFIATRIPGIALFLALTWFLFTKGYALYKVGEVSLLLQIPYYPLAYALSFCCLIQSLVLITDIVSVFDKGEAR